MSLQTGTHRPNRPLFIVSLFTIAALLLSYVPTALAQGGLPAEPFTATSLPTNWSIVNNPTDSPGWSFGNPGNRQNETGGSGNFAIADSDIAGSDIAMDTELRTPAFSLSGVSTARLEFRTLFKPYETSAGAVDVSVDGGTTWVNVWRTTTAVNGRTTVDLSAQAANQANVILRFRYTGTWAWYWQVDDVSVVAVSGPGAPSGLSATVSGSQVALSWQAGANAARHKLQRSTDGANWAAVATLTGANVSYTDSKGVLCGTAYSYRVLASNAAGDSAPSAVAAANTATCPNINSLSEAFTATTAPAGWTVQNNIGSEGWRFDDPANRKQNPFSITNNFAIVDNFQGAVAVMDTELRSPQLNLADRPAVKLSFRSYFYNIKQATVDVDVSSDSGTSWTNVWRSTNSVNNTPFRTIDLDLSAAAGGKSNVIVRFRYYNADRSGIWLIDDVSLSSQGLPEAPTGLAATLDGGGALKLTWASSATLFEVYRAPGGSEAFQKIADSTNGATSFIDTTVASTTAYRYRVKAKNAGGLSPDSNTVDVTSGDRSVRFLDITVSYYDTPANANARRAAIEANIRYFADAVYEMSNGANKLRRIEIYTGGARADNASIVWVASCWPNAHVAGYGRTGLRIEHCDNFQQTSFISDDTAHKNGGYTLGHEMGHFFYSLYDEYRGQDATGSAGSPQSGDNPVENSVMHSQWNAVSGDLNWLNFSTALNDTKKTAQYRVFGASGWETLARPLSDDPREGQRSSGPTRLFHPELAAVAPVAGATPRIDLNSSAAQAEARNALQFVWVGEGGNLQQTGTELARQFVIDISANMPTSQLDALKAELKSLVDSASTGDMIGLITYAGTVTVTQAPVLIGDQASRDTLKGAIDSISRSSDTAVATGEALAAALSSDGAAGIPANASRAVYLFSAAPHTGSVHPFSQTSAYQSAAIAIYAFDFGSDEGLTVDLLDLAEATEGDYFSASDAIDLHSSLSEAEKSASPAVDVDIVSADGVATSSSPYTNTFLVDASIGTLQVDLIFAGAPGDATISLSRPDGSPSAASFTSFTSDDGFGGQYTLASARISAPAAGSWLLSVSTTRPSIALYTSVSGEAHASTPTFFAHVESTTGDEIAYPQPIVIDAYVGKEFPITNVGIRGEVESPNGNISAVSLRDDGVAPDYQADDGYYSVIINYDGDGAYTVSIFFDNNSGGANYTEVGVAPAPAPDGSTRPARIFPVASNFQRTASTTLIVSGSLADDHADDIDGATPIKADNVSIAGRIDLADDFDVFKLDVPANYSGALVLRVAELALGMDPYIFAFAADESWEVEQFLDTEPTSGDYLTLTLPPSAGKTVYIVVSHYDEQAGQGLYDLSVGPGISNEPAVRSDEKQIYRLYLPTVRR